MSRARYRTALLRFDRPVQPVQQHIDPGIDRIHGDQPLHQVIPGPVPHRDEFAELPTQLFPGLIAGHGITAQGTRKPPSLREVGSAAFGDSCATGKVPDSGQRVK